MKAKAAEAEAKVGNKHFSHFGADNNPVRRAGRAVQNMPESGTGRARKYLHNAEEAAPHQQEPGTSHPGKNCHGPPTSCSTKAARRSQNARTQHCPVPDLLIGVVPVINLEWIQKIIRDKTQRGYSTEAVTDTILRRMPDYVNYICPQFEHTHVNFQRAGGGHLQPLHRRDIPSPDESMVVIRFAKPKGIDFQYRST